MNSLHILAILASLTRMRFRPNSKQNGMEQKLFPSTEINTPAADTAQVSHLPLTVVMRTTDAVQAYHTARALYLSANLPFPEPNKHSLTTKIDTHED